MSFDAWKDKILDYEIETFHTIILSDCTTETWKDKILDYEIETGIAFYPMRTRVGNLKR